MKPNYAGIAVVAGVSGYVGGKVGFSVEGTKWAIPVAVGGLGYTGYSLYSNISPDPKSLTDSGKRSVMDPLINIRSESSSSSYKQTEIKTDLHFNNLITQ